MPTPPAQHDEEEARDLLGRIIEALTAILKEHARSTGLAPAAVTSRWNGVVEIEEIAFHAGVIRPNGTIGILRQTWESGGATRYRTLIHEALHSLSPPYSLRLFREYTGWEEGVVEASQRLLRQEVLGKIGVRIAEADFTEADENHKFNTYIEALESIRRELGIAPAVFYTGLLRTPLEQRLDRVRSFGQGLTSPHDGTFEMSLMLANARLRRPIRGF